MQRSGYRTTLLLVWWLLLLTVDGHPATMGPSTMVGPLGTDKALPVPKGTLVIQPTWALSFNNGVFTKDWKQASAGGDFTNFSQLFKITYGLWNKTEIFLMMVTYTQNWAVHVDFPGPRGERGANFGGVGNLLLVGKYQLVPESPGLPGITSFFGAIFPTTHYRRLNPSNLWMDQLGEGGYQFILGCNVEKSLKPFTVYGNLWYNMATDFTGTGVDANGYPAQMRFHPRDTVIANLAAEMPLSQRWLALVEVLSSWDGGRLLGPRSNQPPSASVTVSPAMAYLVTDRLSLALGVAVTLCGKNTDAPITPLLSAAYVF